VHVFVTLVLEEVDKGLPYLLRVHAALHRDSLGPCQVLQQQYVVKHFAACFAIWSQVASDVHK